MENISKYQIYIYNFITDIDTYKRLVSFALQDSLATESLEIEIGSTKRNLAKELEDLATQLGFWAPTLLYKYIYNGFSTLAVQEAQPWSTRVKNFFAKHPGALSPEASG